MRSPGYAPGRGGASSSPCAPFACAAPSGCPPLPACLQALRRSAQRPGDMRSMSEGVCSRRECKRSEGPRSAPPAPLYGVENCAVVRRGCAPLWSAPPKCPGSAPLWGARGIYEVPRLCPFMGCMGYGVENCAAGRRGCAPAGSASTPMERAVPRLRPFMGWRAAQQLVGGTCLRPRRGCPPLPACAGLCSLACAPLWGVECAASLRPGEMRSISPAPLHGVYGCAPLYGVQGEWGIYEVPRLCPRSAPALPLYGVHGVFTGCTGYLRGAGGMG
jgi:hypothetical protein